MDHYQLVAIDLVKRNNHIRSIFQLTWRDLPECKFIINKIYKKYGGKIYKQYGSNLSPKNTFIHYQLYDKELYYFLEDIKLFVIIKNKQLKICTKLSKLKILMSKYGRNNFKSDKIYKKEIDLYKRCIILNTNGKSSKNKRKSIQLSKL